MKKLLIFVLAILLIFGLVSCNQDVGRVYVSFDANGAEGMVPPSVSVKVGDSLVFPSKGSLFRKGYDFVGWNTERNGNGRAYKESQSIKVDGDVFLYYAQWSIQEYSISYELNGGSYPVGRSNPDIYTIESDTFVLNKPEKDGYEFIGWKVDEELKPNKNVLVERGSTGDISFVAVWRPAFSIRYDVNGGEGYIDRTYKQKGESVEVSRDSEISRDGYVFAHWNTSADGSGTIYQCGDLYSDDADLVLFAIWSVDHLVYHPEGPDFWSVTCNDKTVSSVIIPSMHKGKKVTSIENSAFESCSGLESITIPEGVTSIGGSAFRGCSGLKSVTIPEGVTSIDWYTFEGCSGLESITIPEGVTRIDEYAFQNCSGLESITIPEGVTSIGGSAFRGCSGLKEITIPEGVASIGHDAFRGCSGLKSVTIPESVTSISGDPFDGCNGIRFVGLNGYVCNNYTLQGLFQESQQTIESVVMPDGITSIKNFFFYNCTGLKEITIPEGVASIGEYAFEYCSSLNRIAIPEGVTSIGKYAFRGCKSLTTICYSGTCSQWNCITSGWNWDSDTGNYTIHCTDGDIAKN